jgi:hypothetical protein
MFVQQDNSEARLRGKINAEHLYRVRLEELVSVRISLTDILVLSPRFFAW